MGETMKRLLAASAVLTPYAAHTVFGARLDNPVVVPKATVQSALVRGHVAAQSCLGLLGLKAALPRVVDPFDECMDRILSEAAVDNTLTKPFEAAVLFDAFAPRAIGYDNGKREKEGPAALQMDRVLGQIAFSRLLPGVNELGLTAAQVCNTIPHNARNYAPDYCPLVLKYADAAA